MQKCNKCGVLKNPDDFYVRKRDSKPYATCKKCANKSAANRLLQYKREAVKYLGGRCSKCGYDKSLSALEFHHRERGAKAANYEKMKNWSFESKRPELDKCVLLCANCHRELEDNFEDWPSPA